MAAPNTYAASLHGTPPQSEWRFQDNRLDMAQDMDRRQFRYNTGNSIRDVVEVKRYRVGEGGSQIREGGEGAGNKGAGYIGDAIVNDAIELHEEGGRWMIGFGKSSSNIQVDMVEWYDRLAINSPPWADKQAVMSGHVVALDK